jgi:hypothetical protein
MSSHVVHLYNQPTIGEALHTVHVDPGWKLQPYIPDNIYTFFIILARSPQRVTNFSVSCTKHVYTSELNIHSSALLCSGLLRILLVLAYTCTISASTGNLCHNPGYKPLKLVPELCQVARLSDGFSVHVEGDVNSFQVGQTRQLLRNQDPQVLSKLRGDRIRVHV